MSDRLIGDVTDNAWSEAARAAALEARRAKSKGGDEKPSGGGKGRGVKIKAAEAKVAKITAQVAEAKATLTTLKGDLKAAQTDLRELKGAVKSKAATPATTASGKAMGESVKAIYHPGVTEDDITATVGKLQKGKRSDAVEAAKAIGLKVAPSASKGKVIAEIKKRVEIRRAGAQRMSTIELRGID